MKGMNGDFLRHEQPKQTVPREKSGMLTHPIYPHH
jgi:hypothetical protein